MSIIAAMPILAIRDISKAFGNKTILHQISFDVQQGELLAVLGPSGSGKSTLLAIIAGLEDPDGGEIEWDGKSLSGLPTHQRDFGLMFQDYALFPHMSVAENVAFGLRMAGMDPDQRLARVAEMLELVGLVGLEGRDVNTLSGGEQQRVALARSLAPNPRLLMLDEPLGSLDRILRERLVVDIQHILRKVGQTAIYVTHDQEEAFALADRIIILNQGRIEQTGTPQEIYGYPASMFVARFLELSNLIPGEIHQVDGKWKVLTSIGDFEAQSTNPGEVTVLVRPDRASMDGKGTYRLRGNLVECSYRGYFTRTTIDIQGTELTFDIPSTTRLPEIGAEVEISFDPEQTVQVLETA